MKLELKPECTEVKRRHGLAATNSGMSKDGKISWIYKDALLEVTLSQTKEVLASWRFGKVLRDVHTTVSCVADLKYHGSYILLVATSNNSDEGTICFFSVGLRKVIRAVEIPQRVTALEVLFSNNSEETPNWILSKHLQFFAGLVAVGTEAGYTYLLDLCLDDLLINHCNEATPKKLSVVSPCTVDLRAKREQSFGYDRQIALLLDEQCHSQGHFYYRRQDDTIQKVLDEDTVCVSSLKYLPQAGTLAIGFNFGSFQLWRLYNPVLDYSSRYSPDGTSVSNFLVQEPENDPRNFVYIWVVHDDSTSDSVSSICLYQLCFTRKDMYANFGTFYDELESVCARLDHRLTLDPHSGDTKSTWSSSVISCYTIVNPFYTPPTTLSDSFEEGLHGSDLSLSVFVWRAEGNQGGSSVKHWMCIFDLNRWYHAQMPHSIRCHGTSLQVCSYWAAYQLDDIVSLTPSHNLLGLELRGDRVLRFINNSPLPPEEHSFPSALQMTGVAFIMADGCIRARCDGWQGQLLRDFGQNGAQYLVHPADFYHQCLRARLLPQTYEEVKSNSVNYQRKVLLNMALDHGILSTLVPQCINQWSDGEYAEQGCSLSLLLEWAWSKVVSIKKNLDSVCQMLYDWSGHHIDPRTDWQIESLTESLSHLKELFSALIAQSSPTTETGQLELELREDCVTILLQHYNFVRWCISFDLLPEIDEASDPIPGLFAYPVGDLCEAYKKRRLELKNMKGTVDGFSLLLIDNLVECQGSEIKKVWQSLGGDGLYPPPSVQALVNMYLMSDISIELKHAITLYLLQDLAAMMKSETSEMLVASFIQRFMLSPSLVHQIQGLWFIDHRDFEEGVRQLVSPNVHEDICGSWKHAAVVNTLLAQSEAKAATRYLHTRGVMGGSPQEQQLYISVLINNRQVSQAVEYMRGSQNESSCSKLMNHLLKECQSNKLLGHLLQLNLTATEEDYLEQYLRGRAEPHALEPLFLYYLHHSRFLQAFLLNEDMKRMDKLETSVMAQERAATRNRLMDAYLKALPDVTRKLLMEKQKRSKAAAARRVEIQRPKPLSTVVRNMDHTAMSRSHFVMAVIEKVNEVQEMYDEVEADEDEDRQMKEAEIEKSGPADVPFLRTPRTPKISSRLRSIEVIYPDLKNSPLANNPLSAARRKTTVETDGEQMALKEVTQECLQVLQTPLREHKKKSMSPHLPGSQIKTPQSILKVRRLSKTMLPSSRERSRRSSSSRSKRLGYSKSDTSLHTSPPSPNPTEKQQLPSATPVAPKDSTAAATPKQLRFAGVSPSPTPSPTMVTGQVPMRSPSVDSDEMPSIRDTSVTPPLLEKEKPKEDPVTEDIQPQESEEKVPSPMMDEAMEEDVPLTQNNTQKEETLKDAKELPSFAEGPHDRYSDNLGKLIRPDLQSPWKHGPLVTDIGGDHTEVVVDEDITFNIPHTEELPQPLPSMTSSPIESAFIVPTGKALASSLTRDDALKILDTATEAKDIHDTVETQVKEQTSTVLRSEQHVVKISQEIIKTTSKLTQLSVDTGISNVSQRKSLSPLIHSKKLSPSSSTTNADETSPKIVQTKLRKEDSPPATPPLSKRAKLMVSKREGLDLSRKQLQLSPSPREIEKEESPSPKRKTPERRSPSRRSELEERKTPEIRTRNAEKNMEEDKISTSPPRQPRKTPERRSPARKTRQQSEVEDPEAMAPPRSVEEEEEKKSRSPPRRQRKTPDRKSPARKTTKQSEAEDSEVMAPPASQVEKNIEEEEESKSPPRSQRKTPERKSPARKTRKQSEVEDAEAIAPPSSSRSRKSVASKVDTEEVTKESAEKEEIFSSAKEVVNNLSEPDKSPEVPVRRRSARLNTPDRTVLDSGLEPPSPSRSTRLRGRGKTPQKTLQKEEKNEKIDAETRPSPGRRSARRKITETEEENEEKSQSPDNKTERKTRGKSQDKTKSPERQTKINEKAKTEEDKKIEEEEETQETHNLRNRSEIKSPDRFTEAEEPEPEDTQETHNLRTRSQIKTPDRFIEAEEPELPSPGRKTRRQSRTPEPRTPTRRSRRKVKSPEKLNTLEIEPIPPKATSVSPKRTRKDPDPATPTKRSAGASKSPEASPSPTRKSRRMHKSPERLSTDQIESVSPHSSPKRSPSKGTRAETKEKTPERSVETEKKQQASPARTRQGKSQEPITTTRSTRRGKTPDRNLEEEGPTKTTRAKSPTQTRKSSSKSKKNIEEEKTEEDNENDWKLRLEVDEEEEDNNEDMDADFTKTKEVEKQNQMETSEDPLPPASQQRSEKTTKKTSRKEDITKETNPSFVFSPPIKHSLRSHDHDDKSNETQNRSAKDAGGHVFVFSHPATALSDEEQQEINNGEEMIAEEPAAKKEEAGKRKKKRTLYYDSPILLSPDSPAVRRSRRQPTDSQRASANILRRYKPQPRVPRSRRIKPSV